MPKHARTGHQRFHINVQLDRELHLALTTHASEAGLTMSQTVRDLLRHALAVVPTTRDAGWREGYAAAYSHVQHAVQRAISLVNPTIPDGY